MTKALVIAELNSQNTLAEATLNTIQAASQLATQVDVLLAGLDLNAATAALQALSGVHEVIKAEHPAYAHALAENMAALCSDLAAEYQYILASANTFGKNILPRVAGLLDVDMVSEVIKIIDSHTFLRPIYAGNALETVKISETPICLTVRPTAFNAATQGNQRAPIKVCDRVHDLKLSTFIELKQEKSVRPELTHARIVIAGGRALASAENFKLIEDLADALGAAVGATRAAVDAGYIANEYQIGQTGKVVAPDVYFAIGISGAIQHIAGMKDSKIIIAINKDSEAPIFQIADYGVVADLFEAVPQLTQAFKPNP